MSGAPLVPDGAEDVEDDVVAACSRRQVSFRGADEARTFRPAGGELGRAGDGARERRSEETHVDDRRTAIGRDLELSEDVAEGFGNPPK